MCAIPYAKNECLRYIENSMLPDESLGWGGKQDYTTTLNGKEGMCLGMRAKFKHGKSNISTTPSSKLHHECDSC